MMKTTVPTAEKAGAPPTRLKGGATTRRSVPHLVIGAVLVAACAIGGVVAAEQLGDRDEVLALAIPVAVGQVITAQHLKQVNLAVDGDIEFVRATAVSSVVGRPAAYTLPAGAVLTRSAVGQAQLPTTGDAIAAIGLKPGQFPPDLSRGAAVLVLAGATTSWPAVVAGIAEADQTTVISLQLPESDARAVASTQGQLSVVMVAGGR